MRWRVALRLHRHGIHWLCRITRQPFEPATYTLADGSSWTPDLTGPGLTMEVHQ